MTRHACLVILTFISSIFAMNTVYADMSPEVTALQQRWAEVNYLLKGKSQVEAFNTLIEDAHMVTARHADNAEAWIWSGIIRSSYAGVKGGLGALSAAKAAKVDFEQAMTIDANALSGSAYTSLGVLYLNVPGWPVAFGDEDKGVELLKKGLELSPDGIDSNYFYAQYLYGEGRYDEATHYLNQAMNAPDRTDRAIADQGRRGEIDQMLQDIENEQ